MICILSDTHDSPLLPQVVGLIRTLKPTLVIHCGDVTSVASLQLFAGLPLRLAFGNCDQAREHMRLVAVEQAWALPDDQLDFEFCGQRYGVYHGTALSRLDWLAQAQQYDYLFYGHTHVVADERVGRTRVINPGALVRVAQPTIVVLEPEQDELRTVSLGS